MAQFSGLHFATENVTHVLILAKNGLGYILGDFFTNASGHPAANDVQPLPDLGNDLNDRLGARNFR
jgi:hypothetical protein